MVSIMGVDAAAPGGAASWMVEASTEWQTGQFAVEDGYLVLQKMFARRVHSIPLDVIDGARAVVVKHLKPPEVISHGMKITIAGKAVFLSCPQRGFRDWLVQALSMPPPPQQPLSPGSPGAGALGRPASASLPRTPVRGGSVAKDDVPLVFPACLLPPSSPALAYQRPSLSQKFRNAVSGGGSGSGERLRTTPHPCYVRQVHPPSLQGLAAAAEAPTTAAPTVVTPLDLSKATALTHARGGDSNRARSSDRSAAAATRLRTRSRSDISDGCVPPPASRRGSTQSVRTDASASVGGRPAPYRGGGSGRVSSTHSAPREPTSQRSRSSNHSPEPVPAGRRRGSQASLSHSEAPRSGKGASSTFSAPAPPAPPRATTAASPPYTRNLPNSCRQHVTASGRRSKTTTASSFASPAPAPDAAMSTARSGGRVSSERGGGGGAAARGARVVVRHGSRSGWTDEEEGFDCYDMDADGGEDGWDGGANADADASYPPPVYYNIAARFHIDAAVVAAALATSAVTQALFTFFGWSVAHQYEPVTPIEMPYANVSRAGLRAVGGRASTSGGALHSQPNPLSLSPTPATYRRSVSSGTIAVDGGWQHGPPAYIAPPAARRHERLDITDTAVLPRAMAFDNGIGGGPPGMGGVDQDDAGSVAEATRDINAAMAILAREEPAGASPLLDTPPHVTRAGGGGGVGVAVDTRTPSRSPGGHAILLRAEETLPVMQVRLHEPTLYSPKGAGKYRTTSYLNPTHFALSTSYGDRDRESLAGSEFSELGGVWGYGLTGQEGGGGATTTTTTPHAASFKTKDALLLEELEALGYADVDGYDIRRDGVTADRPCGVPARAPHPMYAGRDAEASAGSLDIDLGVDFGTLLNAPAPAGSASAASNPAGHAAGIEGGEVAAGAPLTFGPATSTMSLCPGDPLSVPATPQPEALQPSRASVAALKSEFAVKDASGPAASPAPVIFPQNAQFHSTTPLVRQLHVSAIAGGARHVACLYVSAFVAPRTAAQYVSCLGRASPVRAARNATVESLLRLAQEARPLQPGDGGPQQKKVGAFAAGLFAAAVAGGGSTREVSDAARTPSLSPRRYITCLYGAEHPRPRTAEGPGPNTGGTDTAHVAEHQAAAASDAGAAAMSSAALVPAHRPDAPGEVALARRASVVSWSLRAVSEGDADAGADAGGVVGGGEAHTWTTPAPAGESLAAMPAEAHGSLRGFSERPAGDVSALAESICFKEVPPDASATPAHPEASTTFTPSTFDGSISFHEVVAPDTAIGQVADGGADLGHVAPTTSGEAAAAAALAHPDASATPTDRVQDQIDLHEGQPAASTALAASTLDGSISFCEVAPDTAATPAGPDTSEPDAGATSGDGAAGDPIDEPAGSATALAAEPTAAASTLDGSLSVHEAAPGAATRAAGGGDEQQQQQAATPFPYLACLDAPGNPWLAALVDVACGGEVGESPPRAFPYLACLDPAHGVWFEALAAVPGA